MIVLKRNVKVGDTVIVKAASASIYHGMDGDAVKVLAVFQHENHVCYAFIQPKLGYGALRASGFKTPEGADYKLHTDVTEFVREDAISRYVGCVKARKHVCKTGLPYKDLSAKIEYYKNILVDNFGFTEEALQNL